MVHHNYPLEPLQQFSAAETSFGTFQTLSSCDLRHIHRNNHHRRCYQFKNWTYDLHTIQKLWDGMELLLW